MKTSPPYLLVAFTLTFVQRVGSAETVADPIAKVVELLSSLQQQVISEGEIAQKGYSEFAKMCEQRSAELHFEIKTATSEANDLKATMDKAGDDDAELSTDIEELSGTLSSSEADLKGAAALRKVAAEDFAQDQKDLVDTIGQMERAIRILENEDKEASGAALAQLPVSVKDKMRKEETQRATAFVGAMSAIVDASGLEYADKEKLASFLQSENGDEESDTDEDMDGDVSALKAAKGSKGIINVLQNLLEKAQAQLEGARAKETKERFSFQNYKASLERKVAVASKDMDNSKKAKAEASQTRAEAQGDLEVVQKDLEEDKKALAQLHQECMTRASEFQEETSARDEELKAVAAAKKILKEVSGDTGEKSASALEQVSFVQIKATASSRSPSAAALIYLQDFSKQEKSTALVQLVHKVESVIRNSAVSGDDPFRKVKAMMQNMLDSLLKEMDQEAAHKQYCDKEMGDTTKSKSVKESSVEKLTTKIDTQTSEKMNLRESVSILQQELLNIISTQRQMDKIRKDEHDAYDKNKPEAERGYEAVKKAMRILREYYSKDADEEQSNSYGGGAATTIIGMLEVIEADFAKSLSALDDEEQSAKAAYQKQTAENEKTKAIKQTDITFKTKQGKSLGKSISELSTDLDGVQNELDAINQYYNKLQEECVAKAEPYEERRKRQEKLLGGLQDALQILQGRAALIQETRKSFRGGSAKQEDTALETEQTDEGDEPAN